jgi:hypothetical protein
MQHSQVDHAKNSKIASTLPTYFGFFFSFPEIFGSAQSLIGFPIIIFMDPQGTVRDAALGNLPAQIVAPPTASTSATPTTVAWNSVHSILASLLHIFFRVLQP